MQQLNAIFLLLSLVGLITCSSTNEKKNQLRLWYNQPATQWTEALPVGNGRLGAMVYGGTENEIIQFNEETLWTGQPHDYTRKGAYQYLDTLRNLLWSGKQEEAHQLANEVFMSDPLRQLSYQPFGNIRLHFKGHEKVENYTRALNLENALATVSYEIEGVRYTREVFASEPDQAIIIRLTSDEPGTLSFSTSLTTPHQRAKVSVAGDMITLAGQANDYQQESRRKEQVQYPASKLQFEANMKVSADGGSITSQDSTITVSNADAVTLVLVAATSFVDYSDISADPAERCAAAMKHASNQTYDKLQATHIKDYQSLFNRVSIDLGTSDLSSRPTDERLKTFYEDQDPDLVALLYQYGRYLLISSSRPGTQPANLQGIWNDQLAPPWDSKYTTNINLEMNYWPAELTNLSECVEPLIKMIEELSVTGQQVAREHYNMDGWVFHHNTDLWRGAAPINNANHGIWVTGGAWLCQHLWWHYQFTGNKEFLKETAYPIMKGASLFFTEYLVPDKNHPEWLISGPSNSPEIGGLVMGPTMDHQIIRNLFTQTIEAAGILGVDAEFVKLLKEKKSRIAPNQIGKHGQLQEWLEDVDDPDNQHRHVSHLWGLHPGNEIHPLTTPELAEASKVTLKHRGDGGTGWSRAWKINFWARLLDGDHAFLLLKNLMVPAGSSTIDYQYDGGLYANLFDAHPPFQIDGNFGATAGVTEMVLQSHLQDQAGNHILHILPALPSALPHGKITGLRAMGGFEVSMEWEDSELSAVMVESLLGNPFVLRYQDHVIEKQTEKGGVYRFTKNDFNE